MAVSPPSLANVDYTPYFEEQIKIQHQAIVSFKRWMVGFVVLGILAVLGAVVFNETLLKGVTSPIIGIGGVFITSLSAFPYREITPRRSRIASYDLLKRNFAHLNELPPDDQQKLKELAIETVKKSL